jgi:two-component system, cell cycle sensor histidine kinase and response regulator CckA
VPQSNHQAVAAWSGDIYRDLLERLDVVFWEADPETLQFILVGPKAEALLGYPRAAWTSTATFWTDITHVDDRRRTRDTRMQAVKRCEDHRLEYRVIAADGRAHWIRDIALMKCGDGPAQLCGLMVDVTASHEHQQRDAMALLDESERSFASTFDEAPIGIVHVSLEGRWLRVNGYLCRLLGYTPEELMATSFMAISHPDDVEQDTRAMTELLAGVIGKYEREKRYRHKDGHFVPVKLTAVLHRDWAGAPKYFMSTIEDVTDRDRLEAQLRQGQKMEAVGRLAGGIAHDFNNLLTVIVGYSDLVLRRLDPETLIHRDVEEIRHAGMSAAALTAQLLVVSRKQVLQPQILDLNAIVTRMGELLRRVIGEDVELATRLAAPLDRISADLGQIEQIILNLALNARDAMPRGGSLTIETANMDSDADWVALHPSSSEGPHVMLLIRDTGIGMDETAQAHIFEPFFTTKEAGRGTGLGLATVYGIVKQSGGSILVDSAPGQGTTFRILLPRTEQSAVLTIDPQPSPRALWGLETVLLVEDQPEVRAVILNTLTRQGYKVLEAANAVEALLALENHVGAVQLLLTDVVLPGLSGRDLAKRLLIGRPDLRVLYISGYTDDTIAHHGVLEAGMSFLQKPFKPTELLVKVRNLLDAP